MRRSPSMLRLAAFSCATLTAWVGCTADSSEPTTKPNGAQTDIHNVIEAGASGQEAAASAPIDASTPADVSMPVDASIPARDGEAADTGTKAADAASNAMDAASDAAAVLPKFSFFVTSWRAMRELSGHPDGFGGDLRFGETGEGAGLRGADKICRTIAEQSLAGAGKKRWRAFLSTTSGGAQGGPVHAIERVGEGPWYDRVGRVVANTKADLMQDRPAAADRVIIDDLPNENGVPNHDPDGTGFVDNHDTLTGSDASGMLYDPKPGSTCDDWTSSHGPTGQPRVGHSWVRDVLGTGDSLWSGRSWISSLVVPGCARGAVQEELGALDPTGVGVGSTSGYGGIYCFSLDP